MTRFGQMMGASAWILLTACADPESHADSSQASGVTSTGGANAGGATDVGGGAGANDSAGAGGAAGGASGGASQAGSSGVAGHGGDVAAAGHAGAATGGHASAGAGGKGTAGTSGTGGFGQCCSVCVSITITGKGFDAADGKHVRTSASGMPGGAFVYPMDQTVTGGAFQLAYTHIEPIDDLPPLRVFIDDDADGMCGGTELAWTIDGVPSGVCTTKQIEISPDTVGVGASASSCNGG